MQKNIHPDYHEITVVMTDGSKFTTRSTYGKSGQELKLDIDPLTHPAWIGGKTFINENASKIASFNKKFAGIDFSAINSKKKDK
jgi:large subunit ribosomal protein L31